MRRRTLCTAIRVALFTTMCLVFVFILVTVFGQFRFDSRVGYRAAVSYTHLTLPTKRIV